MIVNIVRDLAVLGRDRPHETALVDTARTWTFADLAGRAAEVARHVQTLPGVERAMVLVDRSNPSVAALFGALWAGLSIAPIDVTEPEARVQELGVRFRADVILDGTGKATVHGDNVIDVSAVDAIAPSLWPDIGEYGAGGERQALVLFTSGSTGQPKGVVRNAAAVNRYLDAARSAGTFVQGWSRGVFLPLQFLAGFNGVLFGVGSGRLTVLADPAQESPDQLLERFRSLRLGQLLLTVSMLRTLMSVGGARPLLPDLVDIWTMGEPLAWADVERAADVFGPDRQIHTAYGSTEGNGFFGVNSVSTSGAFGHGLVPLGVPLPPVRVRVDLEVTTEEQQADGVGELLFCGDVASGYLDDPELDAQRFGVDEHGDRYWRSGDLASIGDDGSILLRGRADDMVKINGRLVEPIEVERVVAGLDGVRGVCVLPRQLGSGRFQLVAHVEGDASLDVGALRATLRGRLPGHLVPGLVVRHDALPLNDRGKVDRAALRSSTAPEPDGDGTVVELPAVIGAAVLGIVARILDYPSLGLDDVLWDVGCDSLAAIEIVAEFAGAFRSSLEPNDLIACRTVRELCTTLQRGGVSDHGFVVAFNEGAAGRPIFMVPGAGAPALNLRMLVHELGEDRPVVVFEQYGLHQAARPDRRIGDVAERNLAELRRIQPHGPYLLLGRSYGGLVAHEMARRLDAAGERVALVLIDTFRSVDGDRRKVQRPSALQRRSVSPVHLAKLVKWRSVRAIRQANRKRSLRRVDGVIGSLERYQAFAEWAAQMSLEDRRPALDVPVWLVHPTGSEAVEQWGDHPQLVTVGLGGDHLTIINLPHTPGVVEVIRAAERSIGH